MVRTKVVAKEPIMQFVAADWLKSGKREDHLASRTSNLAQRFITNRVQFPSCLHGSSQKHFLCTNTCYFEVKKHFATERMLTWLACTLVVNIIMNLLVLSARICSGNAEDGWQTGGPIFLHCQLTSEPCHCVFR